MVEVQSVTPGLAGKPCATASLYIAAPGNNARMIAITALV